jgi:hypothetical protein
MIVSVMHVNPTFFDRKAGKEAKVMQKLYFVDDSAYLFDQVADPGSASAHTAIVCKVCTNFGAEIVAFNPPLHFVTPSSPLIGMSSRNYENKKVAYDFRQGTCILMNKLSPFDFPLCPKFVTVAHVTKTKTGQRLVK